MVLRGCASVQKVRRGDCLTLSLSGRKRQKVSAVIPFVFFNVLFIGEKWTALFTSHFIRSTSPIQVPMIEIDTKNPALFPLVYFAANCEQFKK
jgi:hypothetical protein